MATRTDLAGTETEEIKRLEADLEKLKRVFQQREELWQAQIRMAARVHESLLPRPVRHPRIDVDARYVPVDGLGGDYCQVLFPTEGLCYITMCDVTGHGIAPALLATRVSSEVRRMVRNQSSPLEIIRELNTFVYTLFAKTGLQLTFFVAVIDLIESRLCYSGAGHPGPLLLRRKGNSFEVLESQNMILGVVENCFVNDAPQQTCEISTGDRLLFYTDGLTDAKSVHGGRLNTLGLAELARGFLSRDPFEMADLILEEVRAPGLEPPHDDITLIVAEMK